MEESIDLIQPLISRAIGFFTTRIPPVLTSSNLHFPTRRHFYYALVRTLCQGSSATATYSARPPLPVELVVGILRDAEFTVLSQLSRHVGEPMREADEAPLGGIAPQIFPSSHLTGVGWPLPLVNHEEFGKKVFWKRTEVLSSCSGDPDWRDWFSSAPISAHDLTSVHSMQLLTHAKGIGWVMYPSGRGWRWFDVFLLPEKTGAHILKKYLWRSYSTSYPDGPTQRRTGTIFGPSHEIWRFAQVGDRIGVRVWLRDSGWRDIATTALLIIQEYFVPSFVPK